MDHRNLTELYQRVAPRLLAYFRQHHSTKAMAEDLLQETFLRALKHGERMERATSPAAYLFGIARHIRLDVMRQRPVVLTDADLEGSAAVVAQEDTRLDDMRAAIQRLAEPHRETLLLRLRHELSYAEIAEVLQVPIGTVRSRLHYAVAQLRTALVSASEQERSP